MASGLSPQNEAFILQSLAKGAYPSRESLLDAAVGALRGHQEDFVIPTDHLVAIESAITQLEAGLGQELTDGEYDHLVEQGIADAARPQGL